MSLKIQHILLLVFVFLVLFFGAIAFFTQFRIFARPPEISYIEPFQVNPGDELVIHGRFFRDQRRRSRIQIDGQPPVSSSQIVEWTPQAIKIITPDFHRSSLINVRTRHGESNGVLIVNKSDFPPLIPGPFLSGYPFIEYLDPSYSRENQLIKIYGQNFGDRQETRQLLYTKRDHYSLSLFDEPDMNKMGVVDVDNIALWSDFEIDFYLPDDAVSGPVLISSYGKYSNPYNFERERAVSITRVDEIQYSLNQSVIINNIGALPGNSLDIWIPNPVYEHGVLHFEITENSHQPVASIENAECYNFQNVVTGQEIVINREMEIKAWNIRYDVEIDNVPVRFNQNSPVYRSYTQPTELIPSDVSRFKGIANAVVQDYYHPVNKARAIYDWVGRRLDIDDLSEVEDLNVITDTKRGSAKDYVRLFCTLARAAGIPARPVLGLLFTDEGVSVHWWAEFYLDNAGWIPVDPYLADKENDGDTYWAAVNNRHIPFSKGQLEIPRHYPSSRIPQRNTYFQSVIYEEGDGHLQTWQASWIVPEMGILDR